MRLGAQSPQRALDISEATQKKRERLSSFSLRLINFVLPMYKQLTSAQRYTIDVLLQKKMSKTFIAESIHVSVSTISREIKRNSNVRGIYNGRQAMLKNRRRKSILPGNRHIPLELRCEVFRLIRERQWSPEQIAGRLNMEGKQVSKSTIYNWIGQCSPHYADYISCCLRRGKKKHSCRKSKADRIKIPDRISIDERPQENNGQHIGDWEMDTIVGKQGKGAIVTLVERNTNFMLMRKLKAGKRAEPLAKAVVQMLKNAAIPVRSITTDNGTEFAEHKLIAKALGTTVYFAHPYSSWEKGTIENTNGLIRQFVPKLADFKEITTRQIKNIQDKLNDRPRKKNNFYTPKELIQRICT